MSEYPESALREPDDVQRPLTTREMELEIQLTRAEAEAERVKAEAERTKIAAVGEALKQFVDQPGPKAALSTTLTGEPGADCRRVEAQQRTDVDAWDLTALGVLVDPRA